MSEQTPNRAEDARTELEFLELLFDEAHEGETAEQRAWIHFSNLISILEDTKFVDRLPGIAYKELEKILDAMRSEREAAETEDSSVDMSPMDDCQIRALELVQRLQQRDHEDLSFHRTALDTSVDIEERVDAALSDFSRQRVASLYAVLNDAIDPDQDHIEHLQNEGYTGLVDLVVDAIYRLPEGYEVGAEVLSTVDYARRLIQIWNDRENEETRRRTLSQYGNANNTMTDNSSTILH